MIDHAKHAEAARHAVVAASHVCRSVQDALDEVRAVTKDDKSPVTVADYASQAVVGYALRERLGDVVLVAEEASNFLRDEDNGLLLDAVVAAAREVWDDATPESVLEAIDIGAGDTRHRRFWTLDPIDGTKGFLRNQQYAIALGFIEEGVPTIGVMGCPNLPVDQSEPLDERDAHGCLYLAIKGEGIYETRCDNEKAELIRLTRLDHDETDEIVVCGSVEAAHSNQSDTDRILAWIEGQGLGRVGEPARLDSQCKYAVVARGQADAYLRLPTRKGYVERIWDHAAGACIAGESGAFVTDIHGNALEFDQGRGLEKNRGIVCAPPRVHGLMIRAIEALGIASEAGSAG
ncbi:MAG: 3'(2'),5'-bisphosphate nucleotidase [Phycisphaerales bacterium]|nr:3'(2'),5'-bisphosphate nucleotidase [Planctomycetota bacterium]MCH8508579.1 3'(2'),5'-bisphosphate nucleotidase [Phycisphaerales bacterium]